MDDVVSNPVRGGESVSGSNNESCAVGETADEAMGENVTANSKKLKAPANDAEENVVGSGGGGAIVRLEGVHKKFGSLVVLDGLDLAFERGKTTVVLGPSGTGKSVLLKHIVGLMRPDWGAVYFDGERVDRMRESGLVSVRKRVGFLFQMGALFDSMNVLENVVFPLKEHTSMSDDERADRCEQVLRMVGLRGIEKKDTSDLSGGQRKRVALARAIVLEPDVILYDEPTTGLDPISSDLINELIIGLSDQLGATSIVVTHDMGSANKIADRIVMLYNGRLIADARPEVFGESDNPLVQRFIRGEADEGDLQAIREGLDEAVAEQLQASERRYRGGNGR